MDANQLIQWIFYAAITAISTYLSSTISKLRESVDKLNVVFASEIQKIASVKEKLDEHEDDIKELQKRLAIVEMKSFNCNVHIK